MRILIFILCVLFFGCSQDQYGTTTEEVGVYDTKLQYLHDEYFIKIGASDPLRLKKGEKVKLVDKDGCPLKDGSEKMVLVMLSNQTNDFVNGWKVCVPDRKIKWD